MTAWTRCLLWMANGDYVELARETPVTGERQQRREKTQMITRRRLLEGASAGAALAGMGIPLAEGAVPGMPEALPSGVRSEAVLEALPGKKPLIKLAYRPPNYETPIDYFRETITPIVAFFVLYRLASIPVSGDKAIDPKTWRVAIGDDGANGQASLSLDGLK